MMTRAFLLLAFVLSTPACSSEEAGNGPDAGMETDGGGGMDAPLPPGTCADPVTGQPVQAGTTYESFSLAVATTQNECDQARVLSTCDAQTQQFLPPPASSASCTVEALPPAGTAIYFADCQAGAQAGCVPGNNANAGTSPTAPKRTLDGFDVNGLAAGMQLVFARGGSWTDFHVTLNNAQATPTQPIVFGTYAPSWGGTARPKLRGPAGLAAFEFGAFNSTLHDGGYTLRNLELDGQAGTQWGVWLRDEVRYVLLESLDIHHFAIGIHVQSSGANRVNHLTIRNSTIRDNADHGMLGDARDLVIERNTFTNNNPSGGGFEHAIYLGGEGQHAVIRGNNLVNNSAPNGTCDGGNLTMHGQWDDVLIEGNVITQVRSTATCYGISLNPGYATAEFLRHFVVRGNTIVNLGSCGVCASAAPGIIVENNLIVQRLAAYHAGILIPAGTPGAGDDADGGAVVRNNTVYFDDTTSGTGVAVRAGAGTNVRVVSNLVYFGATVAGSVNCFEHPAAGAITAFDYNLCARAGTAGPYSPTHANLGAAQAAGLDAHGLSSNPAFVGAPTSVNAWSCTLAATSPAVNAGHPTMSSPTGRDATPRVVPDIGACER